METHITSNRLVGMCAYFAKSYLVSPMGTWEYRHEFVYTYAWKIFCQVCYFSKRGLVIMAGLDVVRTDRTLVFYEKQENLSKLWDILAVYAWVDLDVGYCQG